MNITVGELFGLVGQYGLPLVMFFGVIWLSARGYIVWPATVEALEQQIKDAWMQAERERLEKDLYRNELLATKRMAEKSVGISERLADTVTQK